MKVAASMSVGRLAPKHSLDIDGIRAISPNVTPSLIKDDVVIIDRLRRPDGSYMTIEEYTDQTFQPYIDQYNSKQQRKDRQIQTGYCEWHRNRAIDISISLWLVKDFLFFLREKSVPEEAQALVQLGGVCLPTDLSLSPGQAQALVLRCRAALQETGRVEFGEGPLPALIRAFGGSPYLRQENLEAVLGELAELFYQLKNECRGHPSDLRLITWMEEPFDGKSGGEAGFLPDLAARDPLFTGPDSRQ